ncbi:hypothetical protein BSQ97_20985 [Serratia proteamaculans]|nr:hypothetical protein BSQ97_20985 [Serratia proteamaculans]
MTFLLLYKTKSTTLFNATNNATLSASPPPLWPVNSGRSRGGEIVGQRQAYVKKGKKTHIMARSH